MDEIAPEYDIIVLGTGKLCLILDLDPAWWGKLSEDGTYTRYRSDRMCALWVWKLLEYSLSASCLLSLVY